MIGTPSTLHQYVAWTPFHNHVQETSQTSISSFSTEAVTHGAGGTSSYSCIPPCIPRQAHVSAEAPLPSLPSATVSFCALVVHPRLAVEICWHSGRYVDTPTFVGHTKDPREQKLAQEQARKEAEKAVVKLAERAKSKQKPAAKVAPEASQPATAGNPFLAVPETEAGAPPQ